MAPQPGYWTPLPTRVGPFDSPWRWRKGISKGITEPKKPTKGLQPR